MSQPSNVGQNDRDKPPFAPVALTDDGEPVVVCEMCGSTNLAFEGDDIDKCRNCGHWRNR